MFSSDPNQPVQNYEIVNPTLEQQVASLLPSVAGYGGNLRSTNTIIPVVDLTSAAEGTTLPESLQQALTFGSQTAFEASNTTTTLASTTGFWRVVGVSYGWYGGSTGFSTNEFILDDGIGTKRVWAHNVYGNAANPGFSGINFDLIFFLPAGHSLKAKTNNVAFLMEGSYRQVATVDGTLVDPSGFS